MRLNLCALAILFTLGVSMSQSQSSSPAKPTVTLPHDFQVIEFRRYTIRDGEREHFTSYFEAYFPEAFQQLGAIAFGDFIEPEHPEHFTWIRGFHDMDERAKVNSAFYYGPVWKEHKATLNSLMTDSDNVLLLHPLDADSQVPVLPAVDPVTESAGAKGMVVAQIFRVKPGQVDAVARTASTMFARYREAGARDAGVLATLDAPNNFPQLPVRTDGPYLVWLGILPDDAAIAKFKAVADEGRRAIESSGAIQGTELVVLRPNPRSRLRWLNSK